MSKKLNSILEGLAIGTGAGVLGLLALIFLLLLNPVLAIAVGWVVGTGLKWIAGSYIASGLSIIFHTTITADMLPLVFVTLTLLSTYIKPMLPVNRNSDKK